MALAIVIKRLVAYCTSYDAAYFEGMVLPSLVPRSEKFKSGELVIYVWKSRYSWKNNYFAGKVVRPEEAGVPDAKVGDEYPITLDDFVV